MIPFLELNQINKAYEEKFQTRFQQFLARGYYVLGDWVKEFETQFAAYTKTNFCVGTGNGLDALKLMLKAYMVLGRLEEGDKVILAANTYIATILAVKEVGLVPLLVEPDEATFNLNPDLIQDQITPKTRAILVTHLYGQLADMQQLSSIALKNGLLLLADAAQSHGARLDTHEELGQLADAAGYSFYPTKNLGALGDAGAVTTNDKQLSTLIKALRNYGSTQKYQHDFIGYNSRLDELQAGFLLEKLPDLDRLNQKRREIAQRYLSEIKNDKIRLPYWDGTEKHVFHLFVVRVKNREEFCVHLEQNEIGYMVHYPKPPHQQKALQELNELHFPVTEKIHREVVSIPLHPLLANATVEKIIEVLNRY